MATDKGTQRTAVKTYVPAYQKAEWEAHAAGLGMTQSEFVRTMVQAGRRDFEVDPEEQEESDDDPGGRALEDQVLGILEKEPQDWDELLAAVTEDIEAELDAALEQLQSSGRVRYSGRAGGYTLTEGDG